MASRRSFTNRKSLTSRKKILVKFFVINRRRNSGTGNTFARTSLVRTSALESWVLAIILAPTLTSQA